MKKILLVISMISVLLLAGCNKNENVDNANITEDTNNQQQEQINISDIQNEENEKIEENVINDKEELFSDRIRNSKDEFETLKANKDYAIDYVALKKDNDDYVLKIVFKRIARYVDDEFVDPYYLFDDNDVKTIDFKLMPDDLLNISNEWYLFDGSNREMSAGEMRVSELYDLGVFSYDARNGLWLEEITDDSIIVSINMAGLT